MIAIKDMKMPSCCFECFFYDEFDGFCRMLSISKWDEYIKEINHSDNDWKYEKRADICPLVEIEEHKTGEWIFAYGTKGKDNVEKCSCCWSHWKEAIIYASDTQEYLRTRLLYCPNCGADMRGDENDC